MRRVLITLEKKVYSPSEVVRGEVTILTDGAFEANRVTLHFSGIERARVVRGTGDSRRVYEEKIVLVDDKFILHEGGIIPEGETRLPFELHIPSAIPGSYYGHHGSVRYTLKANVEISWALDPNAEKDVMIVRPLEHVKPKASTKVIDWDGMNQILVEIPRHTIAPPEPFPVRVMVRGDPSVRGIRFEILFKETVAPKGRVETVTRQLSTVYLDKEHLSYESWMDIGMQTSERWFVPFVSRLIKTEIVLKVTADIPFRFDRSVEFHLAAASPCSDLFDQDDFLFGY